MPQSGSATYSSSTEIFGNDLLRMMPRPAGKYQRRKNGPITASAALRGRL
jgi:hypothetical protein